MATRKDILSDFRPYTWYDISKYPYHAKVSTNEIAPYVSLLVKYYDPRSDTFKFYKVLRVSCNHTYGKSHDHDDWNCPQGHRPVGFMWDGEDLPMYEGSDRLLAYGSETHPELLTRTIPQEARERNNNELTAQAKLSDETGTASTFRAGEGGKLAFPEGSAEPPLKRLVPREVKTNEYCDFYDGAHSFSEHDGICSCGAARTTEEAVRMGR